jgi:small ligand-binding sensory domain FIST
MESTTTALASAAVSRHYDTRTAAMEVAHRLTGELPSPPDLVLMFGSYHHTSAFAEASETILRECVPGTLLATTAESVIGGDRELEGLAGLSAIGVRLPGARVSTFRFDHHDTPSNVASAEYVGERIGVTGDHRATFLLADPFSTPLPVILNSISEATIGRSAAIVGGLASGASQPGHNVLICNGEPILQGAVGITISGGDTSVEVLVSQGCRAIGTPMVVTKAKDNVLIELGGRPAFEVAQETAQSLPEHQKRLLAKGLFVGQVINEYKPRFGRGDFLIRNIVGVNQQVHGLILGETIKVGQTVQFHVRDSMTATEDLQLLLDGEQLKPKPSGVVLITCNGRGSRLFPTQHHDASAISSRLGSPPIAGFFAAGEIGPIGGRTFLHGHTACAALFRPMGIS